MRASVCVGSRESRLSKPVVDKCVVPSVNSRFGVLVEVKVTNVKVGGAAKP